MKTIMAFLLVFAAFLAWPLEAFAIPCTIVSSGQTGDTYGTSGCWLANPCNPFPQNAWYLCGSFSTQDSNDNWTAVNCGGCPYSNQQCGGSLLTSSGDVFEPNACYLTCASQGAQCGGIKAYSTLGGAPSGGTLDCGSCPSGQACTSSNQCCTQTTCVAAGVICGPMPDGCGGTINCPSCPGSTVCSGGQCIACARTTCEAQGAQCGTIPNKCGGTLTCGSCSSAEHCDGNSCIAGATPPNTPAMPASMAFGLVALVGLGGWGIMRRRRA